MSTGYNNRKKERKRAIIDDLIELGFGRIPERLKDKYPGKDARYVQSAENAIHDFNQMVKRMIRQKKISRFVLTKDSKGRPLFRSWKKCKGVYKSADGKTKIHIGTYLKQTHISFEMLKTAREQHANRMK